MTDELYLPDQGDGSYRNPVLCCDYSDPDVIRVGDTYDGILVQLCAGAADSDLGFGQLAW